MAFGHLFVPSQAPAGTQSFGWYGAIDQPRQPTRIALADGTSWVPQTSFVAATPNTLGWLQPFPQKTAPRPFYDLNITWVPQPSFVAGTPNTLGWLQAFSQRTAPRPFFDLNSGWVPFVPPAFVPPVTTNPFPITQFAARRFINQVLAY